MEVIPAIDLKGGKGVRLYQGDFQQAQVYADDPLAVALEFEAAGAPRLHIVDLDGAAAGVPVHLEQYGAITTRVSVPVQVGGGIRDLDTAARVLALGLSRLVLGTTAVEEPRLVQRLCQEHGGDALVVSLDARDGMVAVRGWQETTQVPALELLEQMAALGVRRFLYTDISRDGTLSEPNFPAVADVVKKAQAHGVAIIGAGGISSMDHLKRLASLGVEGAIIGRALYTGALTLRDALAAVAL